MPRYYQFIERHFDIFNEFGDEVQVRCAFHDDRSPSMYVNTRKGLFYCHACGERGTIEQLADRLGTHVIDTGIPVSTLKRRLELIRGQDEPAIQNGPLPESYLEQFDFPHPFWDERRGFSQKTIRRFRLGFDPKTNRVTIPMRSSKGKLQGIIYRRLDDRKPKYMYPRGFAVGKTLFGSWLVRDKHRKVALVEGPLDAVACWDARVPAMALMGARLSNDQRTLLRSLDIRTVVVMTDNDNAGHEAIEQITRSLKKTEVRVRVGVYRSYWREKDPGDLKPIRRRKMFHSAMTLHDFRHQDGV